MSKKLDYSKIAKKEKVNKAYHRNPNIKKSEKNRLDTNTVTFGMHIGKEWSSVDSSYLYWVLVNRDDFQTKESVIVELIKRDDAIWTHCMHGKRYYGRKWKDVPTSYLQWMVGSNFSSSIKNISTYHLRKRLGRPAGGIKNE